MNYNEIENQLRIQLCTKLNRTCDDALEKLIKGLMYNIINYNAKLSHERHGTMEVKNEHYYEIDFKIENNILDIKLYYTVNNAYRGFHKVNMKL